jgi:hypothetical protein
VPIMTMRYMTHEQHVSAVGLKVALSWVKDVREATVMAAQHEIDTGTATPEREGSLQEEAEEKVPEEKEEGEDTGDYYLGRVDKLLHLDETNELPRLDPQSMFAKATTRKTPTPEDKGRFESRLTHFMKSQRPEMLPLSSELVEFLFNRATNAQRCITAWDSFVKNTKSPDLKRDRVYLQQELNRYVKIRSILSGKKRRTPSWMAEWSRCWVGALEEIQEEIEAELRCALRSANDLYTARKSARVEVESYTLWVEKAEIRKHPAAARNLEVVLGAFAYAGMIVLPKSNNRDDLDDFVASIKQRVSRVARSKDKRTEALSLRLRAMFGALDGHLIK